MSGVKRHHLGLVTPLAGVWVEIEISSTKGKILKVTPLAGVWVEIVCSDIYRRHPRVTPLAGVWVEILHNHHIPVSHCRHSPCGSVG